MKQLHSRNVMGIVRIALIFLFATQFFSCTDEQIPTPPINGEEKLILFSVKVPGGFTPVTYKFGADEEVALKTVDVILFRDGNYFSGPHYGVISNVEDGTGKATVAIKIPDGTATYSMSVFANCRNQLNGASLSGDKENIFQTLLESRVPGISWSTTSINKVPSEPIPMWGETDISVSEHAVSGAVDVTLIRMLSRINVYNTADNFTLTSVHLYNYNTSGRIAPALTNLENNIAKSPSLPKDVETGTISISYSVENSSDGNKCENEIYTFETSTIDEYDEDNPCIVVGGEYNGQPYYYRIDFVDASGKYLPLLRNHKYEITISAINGGGYAYQADAYASKPVNVKYDIKSWDDGKVGGITTDGQYRLGVSASTLDFDANPRTENSSDNILTIFSDYGNEVAISNIVTNEGSDWLNITIGDNPLSCPGTITLTEGTANLRLLFGDNSSGIGTRTATFTLTAGRMSYEIEVSQSERKKYIGEIPPIIAKGLDNYYPLGSGPHEFIVYSIAPFTIGDIDPNVGTLLYDGSVAAPNGTIVTFTPATSEGALVNEVRTTDLILTANGAGWTYSINLNLICSNISNSIVPAKPANCYIVHPNGAEGVATELAIPISQAYRALGSIDGGVSNAVLPPDWFDSGEFAAELVWKDSQELDFDISMVWDKVGPSAIMYVKPITISSLDNGGNAVIGIKKKNSSGQPEGDFLWSWHIWVTDYMPPTDDVVVGESFMDRNLGAIGKTPGKARTLGLLYQWGRKDPFSGAGKVLVPSSGNADEDNYQPIYSASGEKMKVWIKGEGGYIQDAPDTKAGAKSNLETVIRNPQILYCNSVSPYDWYTTNTANVPLNNNLWGGFYNAEKNKTVYDPCPYGWRVPRVSDAGLATNSNGAGYVWSSGVTGTSPWAILKTDASNSSSFNFGYTWDGTSPTPDFGGFYPAAGMRATTIGYVGERGHYWTASLERAGGTNAGYMWFANGSIFSTNNHHRASAFSLRCVKDLTD